MNNLPDFSVNGYQVIRQLGLNAAGGRVVYLATDSKTQKQVAIKQFQFAKGAAWSEFKAIEREMQVLQGLNHRGIPHHVGSFETDDGYCIVQEYKNAQPLSAPRSFDPDEVKQIAVSVLEILVYLQSFTSPIIHRDIKPENVVIDKQLNVYLIDFGLARAAGATTASSMAAGTFGFMAPEQIYNKDLTKATDLYSLGATLIALLTGTKSTEMDILIDEDSKIAFQDRVPKLSLRFIEWLENMVAPKLKDRYPSGETALAELQPLYITRFPSVEFNQSELEFTATRLGQYPTQIIAIINSTPETVLEGKWSVAPHPNDPPHSSDSHAWISFSPREFKGNEIECRITVDTSKLIAQASGERSLILQTNSVPETHELELNITTAPLPFVVKRLPYLTTALWLILAGLAGFLCAHFGIVAESNTKVMPEINAIIVWTLVGTGLGRVLHALLPKKVKFNIFVWQGAFLGTLIGGVAELGLGNMFLIGFILAIPSAFIFAFPNIWQFPKDDIRNQFVDDIRTIFKAIVIIFTWFLMIWFWKWYLRNSPSEYHFLVEILAVSTAIAVVLSTAAVIVEEFAREYLRLNETRRYKFSLLILLMLSTGAFGFSLGICIKIGFLSSPYLLLATLGTGVLSTFLFFFAPLQCHRRISAYRQSEKNLIQP